MEHGHNGVSTFFYGKIRWSVHSEGNRLLSTPTRYRGQCRRLQQCTAHWFDPRRNELRIRPFAPCPIEEACSQPLSHCFIGQGRRVQKSRGSAFQEYDRPGAKIGIDSPETAPRCSSL